MKYRPDIDGLRAFAVLVVVWFHAGLGGGGGGFIGVDVFFVISGYLIGGIIVEESANGRFSYLQFYTRRTKRLFPAFLVVALVTTALAWWLMLPRDLVETGRELVASAFGASNLLFYQKAGYFDGAAITKPLLHTWSLSVEEQFYLFFPLLLVIALRAGQRALPLVLGLVASGSVIGAQYLLGRDPSASFYLLPTRAWELMLGALVALPHATKFGVPHALRRTLDLTAVACLFLPVLMYTEHTPFPGVAAVPSCLGAAWVLWNGRQQPDSVLQRALGSRVPVFIGKISYSFYLWHWPAIVFMTYYQAGEMGLAGRAGAVLGSFALAVLSWRYVEQPVRQSNAGPALMLGATAAGIATVAGIGFLLWRHEGVPGRLNDRTRAVAEAAGDFMQNRGGCEGEDNGRYPGVGYCHVGAAANAPDFLVWGDSHASAMRDGMDQLARENGVGGLIFSAGGCMPLFDLRKRESAVGPRSDALCTTQNQSIRAMLAAHSIPVRRIVLVGRWTYYIHGSGIGADSRDTIYVEPTDGVTDGATPEQSQAQVVASAVRRTAAWLDSQGYEVYLLEQVPEIPFFDSRKLFQAIRSRGEDYAQAMQRIGMVPRAEVEARQDLANRALESATADGVAKIIRTHDMFCTPAYCSAEVDSAPAYMDNNHVRGKVSIRMRHLFSPLLEGTMNSGASSAGSGPASSL